MHELLKSELVVLRDASMDDVQVIARHRYFRGEALDDFAAYEAYEAWLPERIERGVYVGVMAAASGNVIAGAGAVLLDWGPTRGGGSSTRARIVNVFTDHAWRRRGLARALVGKVIQGLSLRGADVCCLAASDDGASIYRSLGFERYEHEMILRLSR